VYMQVWRDARRYDASRGRVLAWLMIITRTRSLDYLRRADEAFSHPEPQTLAAEPTDARDDPLVSMIDRQSNRALHDALTVLTPVQRQLLSLAFFRGLSHSEIVEHTAMPLGSVKTHIRRALQTLKSVLDGADALMQEREMIAREENEAENEARSERRPVSRTTARTSTRTNARAQQNQSNNNARKSDV
jgi:RNA polymerase sigma factor (sigma-70 family)